MKQVDEIDRELAALVEKNYYGDESELEHILRLYFEGLEPVERESFKQVVLKRLAREVSAVNILLAGVSAFPEVVPVLVSVLNAESKTSQITRSLMNVLRNYNDEAAFKAVARFLDSEQEIEALMCLCGMNFLKALPHIKTAVRRDHLFDACLQVFYERKKAVGLDGLQTDLRALMFDNPSQVRDRLRKVFLAKRGKYNPFTPEEVVEILAGFEFGS